MSDGSRSSAAQANQPSGWSSSFIRCLAAAGLGSAALAVFDWSSPSIDSPGPLAPLLLAGALLVSGPPRAAMHSRPMAVGAGLLVAIALWGAGGALGWPMEKSAALLSLPIWGFLLGLGLLGSVLNGTGRAFPLIALCIVGICRIAGEAIQGRSVETVWWIASFVWMAASMLPPGTVRRTTGDSMALVAGILWFVLLLAALTVQEVRHPLARFGGIDDASALDAVRARPLAGFGGGAFEGGAMLEFTRRGVDTLQVDEEAAAPRLATIPRYATRAILRLIVDAGIPAVLGGLAGLSLVVASSVRRTQWTRQRVAGLGIAGFWLAALFSMREPWPIPMAIACLSIPAALGHASAAASGTERGRPWAFQVWGVAMLLMVVPAVMFPAAQRHWKRQNVLANPKVDSILGNWSVPWQDKAWAIRARSPEIAKYADPRDWLDPVVDRWLRTAPHSELAWIERIRLAEKRGGPVAAEKAALEASERLPSSAIVMLWVARSRVEQGRIEDAVAFLEDAVQRRGGIHPRVHSRIVELRMEVLRQGRR